VRLKANANSFLWYNSAVLRGWLRFFRVVNLPTVPGDVLVGAAAASAGRPVPIAASCLAAIFLYMFGLADNDIVGAETDDRRPIGEGLISVRAARVARGLCLLAALVVASLASLPSLWWITAFALAAAIVVYNRTKLPAVMGVCRGLNVACGGAVSGAAFPLGVSVCMVVWTLYIASVTKYSEGEEANPEKKRFVGLLIGALVYLQLFALLVAYLLTPNIVTRNLLLAGAGLLAALRLMKRGLPGVSAS